MNRRYLLLFVISFLFAIAAHADDSIAIQKLNEVTVVISKF